MLHLPGHHSTSQLIMRPSLSPEFYYCFRNFFTEMQKAALSPERFWNGLLFLNLESFNLTFATCLRLGMELVGFTEQASEVSS